ncbi:VanZ family protein [Massilia sp. TSP1-1-2]|uniref:VanZ family protein n=1 Tax=unclassified Massilia TaxID=2609279 RepID=UPI003CF3CD3C
MFSFVSLLVLDERLRRRRFYGAFLMFSAILVMGSIPGARAEIGEFGSGVVLHSLAYGSLTFLLYTGSTGSRSQRAIRAVLTVALMGALDEFVQSFLPYRTASTRDWLVDCCAASVMAGLLWRFMPEPVASRHP